MNKKPLAAKMDVQANPQAWSSLSAFTQARIGLGHAGVSLPTNAQLQFNVDHALARDAVNTPLDITRFTQDLQTKSIPSICLQSAAGTREQYLQRPDLGRRLNDNSIATLNDYAAKNTVQIDVALVIVDGLSSIAVERHGAELAKSLSVELNKRNLVCSPAMVVEQGRVAIGDEIGESLKVRSVVLLVGERPGLSSPDSLGIYYTYSPKQGLNDASRNCISNIRPAGLTVREATNKTLWLIEQSFTRKLSGVALKDTSQHALSQTSNAAGNFLLPK